MLDRATDGDRQHVDLHRLGDEVVRAGADRGDRGLEAALAGQHDGEHVGVTLLELLTQLDAGDVRHLHVGHDHVGRLGAQKIERRGRRADGLGGEPPLAQAIAQEGRSVFVIVDDEDRAVHVCGHTVLPWSRPELEKHTPPPLTRLAAVRRRS